MAKEIALGHAGRVKVWGMLPVNGQWLPFSGFSVPNFFECEFSFQFTYHPAEHGFEKCRSME